MERRQLLKGGMLLSAALLGDALVSPDPAEATTLFARFFNGTIDDGGGISEWTLWLGVAGHRVNGVWFDPTTSAPDLVGFRVDGRLQNHRLRASLYALDDTGLENPIGSLNGRNRRGDLVGTFSLDDGEEATKGEFSASLVDIDEKLTNSLAGTYLSQALDSLGGVLGTGDLVLRRRGRYSVENIQPGPDYPPDGAPLPTRLSGFFGVTTDGRLWYLPTSVQQTAGLRARNAGVRPDGTPIPDPDDPLLLFCFLCFLVSSGPFALSAGGELSAEAEWCLEIFSGVAFGDDGETPPTDQAM